VPCTAEVQLFGPDEGISQEEWNRFFENACNRAVREARSGFFSFSGLVSRGVKHAGDVRPLLLEETLGQEVSVDRMWIGFLGLPYTGVTLDRARRPFDERARLLAPPATTPNRPLA
jgi:hypothetical protein